MGAGSTSTKNQYKALLERYKITREEPTEGLLYLREQDGGEFVLREWTFNDKREYDKCLQNLERKKSQLSSCKFVSPLQQIIQRSEDQYCSTFYKVYTLFPYSQRTLENEITQRNLQKRRFQQSDLWSILASCVLGLAHLQRNSIKHESLRSSTILISPLGIVKIFDPIATGCQSNYDSLLTRRNTPHLYLSPQLTEGLQRESSQPACNPYKSDIFTLAMIILEAGLGQYQDECYRDQCSRVHWETVQYHLHKFRQTYSEELAELIELMLSREEKNRPDWLQLEERAMKEDEGRTSLAGKSSFGKVENVNGQRITSGHRSRGSDLAANLPAQFITSQVVSQHTATQQDALQPRHNHLYNKPPQKQPVLTPYINQNPSSFVTSNLHRNSSQIRQAPVPLSIIESTRPLRSIFPATNYQTLTKVDENLVVINEQDRTTDQNDTPSNNKISSQLDQSVKQPSISAGFYSQPPSFYNTFTPVYQPPAPDIKYNSQGVSFFESDKKQTVPRGQFVIQRYKQGSEYKGYKFQGMRHGFGTFYYQDGGMYEGDWQYNKMAGKGKLFYQSGKLAYEGGWANDQFQGQGILYNQYPQLLHQPINYRNLDQIEQYWTKYEGQFHEDLKSGHGTLFLSNGQYFEGQFREDAANGSGNFVRMNSQHVSGRWLNNSFVG